MSDPTTDMYLLLRAFCDELARCGVSDACTSPGSRSTPLVLSLVREPGLRTWSHLDERVAGFFALGLAKQSGRPVAIAVTSGTAAAELAPAVIEAHEARVPLLVLTADRPPELRDVGAGQTIDQLKLYGGAAKWFTEVGVVGEATAARVRWMRQLACRAAWTAAEGRPGVVHLNFPLREPLVLTRPLPDDPAPGRPDGRPWVTHPRLAAATGVSIGASGAAGASGTASASGTAGANGADGASGAAGVSRRTAGATGAALIAPARRAVVVAGRDERDGGAVGAAAAAFAASAGYPLLADPLSGARRGAAAIAHYDALLRDGAVAGELRPDLVIRVGDLPTSKPLRAWLASLDGAEQVALDGEGLWHDPDGAVTTRLTDDPQTVLSTLAGTHADAGDPAWLERWRQLDEAAARAFAATIGDQPGDALSEPRVAAELTAALSPDATLYVAASMPIRDVETFTAASDEAPTVVSNRGANGIDGTVATALGAAAANRGRAADRAASDADTEPAGAARCERGEGPVVLLIGDVALAYDLSALISARRLGLDLAIVLINNDGGGIFHFLAVHSQRDAFEEHVATPHGLDFAAATALYGGRHVDVRTAADLRDELAAATRPGAGVTIIEATTDRDENVALHRRVWAALDDELRRLR
jgi:2-succinyl-5-enolpyruvyl-6-hydroxy-3-cyclohexene-1-carboxylate synthase